MSLRFAFINVQVQDYQNILKIKFWSFTFTSYKTFFWKKKEVWSPCLIFCTTFEEKYLYIRSFAFWSFLYINIFILLHYIKWPNQIFSLLLLLEIMSDMCILCVSQFVTSDILKLTQSTQSNKKKRSKDKKLNTFRTKRVLKMK